MGLDPKSSVTELAEKMVELPDGTDFSELTLNRVLLLGKPEERDPLKYADVFETVTKNPKASVWMRFACWAEKINGRRRAKGADMAALADELDQLVFEASNELPNYQHKYTLLGRVLWNAALVRRGLRRYSEAAQAQRQSSAWHGLAGNAEQQMVGLFAAQVEEVTAAFVAGDDKSIVRSLRALVAAKDLSLNASNEYPNWMKDNAPVHIAWALAMAEPIVSLPHPELCFENYLEDARTAAKPFAQWAKVFEVLDMYANKDYEGVIRENPVDLQSSSADNAGLTVRVVVGAAHLQLDHEEEYRKCLQAVMAHSGPDGGLPMAVAKRLLNES